MFTILFLLFTYKAVLGLNPLHKFLDACPKLNDTDILKECSNFTKVIDLSQIKIPSPQERNDIICTIFMNSLIPFYEKLDKDQVCNRSLYFPETANYNDSICNKKNFLIPNITQWHMWQLFCTNLCVDLSDKVDSRCILAYYYTSYILNHGSKNTTLSNASSPNITSTNNSTNEKTLPINTTNKPNENIEKAVIKENGLNNLHKILQLKPDNITEASKNQKPGVGLTHVEPPDELTHIEAPGKLASIDPNDKSASMEAVAKLPPIKATHSEPNVTFKNSTFKYNSQSPPEAASGESGKTGKSTIVYEITNKVPSSFIPSKIPLENNESPIEFREDDSCKSVCFVPFLKIYLYAILTSGFLRA